MKQKYYAVRVGRNPGIYSTWDECKKQVEGYKLSVYKSFSSMEEAEAFIKGDVNKSEHMPEIIPEIPYAFVDGSFNAAINVYGYGGFLVTPDEKIILTGHGNEPGMASMRNVAGEILGAKTAVFKALEMRLTSLTIYYDYVGIEAWATGVWKANLDGTRIYRDFMQQSMKKINIQFIKVKGHSGIEGNEEADRLAKKAVGLTR